MQTLERLELRWQERHFFTEQMALLLDAGISLTKALQLLANYSQRRRLQFLFQELEKSVMAGRALSTVLAKAPKSFSHLYLALIRVGEQSGQLPAVFHYLESLERTERERGMMIRKALRYPLTVFIVALGVLLFILTAIVPTFESIYRASGEPLPLLTQKVIDFSHFLFSPQLFYGITLLLILFWGIVRLYHAQGRFRYAFDRMVLEIPFLGSILQEGLIVRCAVVLHLMLQSGVTLVNAMKLFANSVENCYQKERLEAMIVDLSAGNSLHQSAMKSGLMSDVALTMISIGEVSGELEIIMRRIADYHSARLKGRIEGLIALIDPLSMLLIGTLVGVILIALYLPLFNIGAAL